MTIATFKLGWHFETGVQLLERIAALGETGLDIERSVADYLRENVNHIGSGMMSRRYLRWTMEVVGADRVMYATDYPYIYAGNGAGRAFLEQADLGSEDTEKSPTATGSG